jgi:hypothetical protein
MTVRVRSTLSVSMRIHGCVHTVVEMKASQKVKEKEKPQWKLRKFTFTSYVESYIDSLREICGSLASESFIPGIVVKMSRWPQSSASLCSMNAGLGFLQHFKKNQDDNEVVKLKIFSSVVIIQKGSSNGWTWRPLGDIKRDMAAVLYDPVVRHTCRVSSF